MSKILWILPAFCLLSAPAFPAQVPEGSQPWGGMVSDRVAREKAQRSDEARKILDMARRLEARYAGMEFEETPDEKELREYLRGMARRSLGATPPESFTAKESSGKTGNGPVRKERKRPGITVIDDDVPEEPDDVRQAEYAKEREAQERVRKILEGEKAKAGFGQIPESERKMSDSRKSGPQKSGKPEPENPEKSVTTTTADRGIGLSNGKKVDVKAGRRLDTSAEPVPEVDIIENGTVSDSEWMTRNQREVEEVVQERRKDVPFAFKGKRAEVFIHPFNADAMQLWKDMRVNRDARRLLDEGRIVVYVPHETFEDSGPAMAYAWMKDKGMGFDFLDFVADLPQKSLVPGNGMAGRIHSWMAGKGHPIEEIAEAGREGRASAVSEMRGANRRLAELKGGFGKFPQIYLDGKPSPNLFLPIETQK